MRFTAPFTHSCRFFVTSVCNAALSVRPAYQPVQKGDPNYVTYASRSSLRHHKKNTPIDFNPAQCQSCAAPTRTTAAHHAWISSTLPFLFQAAHIPTPSLLPSERWLRFLPMPSAPASRLAICIFREFNARSRRPRPDVTYRDIVSLCPSWRPPPHTYPPDTTTARCTAANTTEIDPATTWPSSIGHTLCPALPSDDKVLDRSFWT